MYAYPDLLPIIRELERRKESSDPERQQLLAKWAEDLMRIHEDMRRLEKLDKFTRAVNARSAETA
ncbi:MAG: hypothetical protein GC134_02300 [Proteobacteria bacterium]|nr:hypothetical protein [Pseudomonadota bacterium]